MTSRKLKVNDGHFESKYRYDEIELVVVSGTVGEKCWKRKKDVKFF